MGPRPGPQASNSTPIQLRRWLRFLEWRLLAQVWLTWQLLTEATPLWGSLVSQMVKHLPAMRETQEVGQKDSLEKEMATHSSTLARKIPWMEEPGRLGPWGQKESDMTE